MRFPLDHELGFAPQVLGVFARAPADSMIHDASMIKPPASSSVSDSGLMAIGTKLTALAGKMPAFSSANETIGSAICRAPNASASSPSRRMRRTFANV